jgi:hypothetical protein
MTSGIAIVLVVWALYAFSAAGVLMSLPFARTVLVLISTIYLLRAIAGFFLIYAPLGRSAEFWFWSSSICLVFGIIHVIGLKQA